MLHGSQQLGGLDLPERITRYRVEDGQEHVFELETAQWVQLAADRRVAAIRVHMPGKDDRSVLLYRLKV